nr:lipoprotein [uncultured Gammaproteobacteria bacterium]
MKITSKTWLALLGGLAWADAFAATADFDPATNTVTIHAVDLVDAEGRIATYNVTLALVQTSPAIELVLTGANQVPTSQGVRAYFDATTQEAFIPTVNVGGQEFAANLALIPGTNPLRFRVTNLHPATFSGCPRFSRPLGSNACLLQGEIKQSLTLTNDTTWVLSGGVFFGGDNTDPVTVTIEPGTKILGQQGADFFYVRRGSKIKAVGSPSQPIVFTGPSEKTPGEWGGLVLAGNAPVNGCNAGVPLCQQFDEAMLTPYGGNNPHDDSGVLKYVQIRFAGIVVRPDQELNGLTLLGVGDGTTIDYVQVYRGADDGIEMFGGTVRVRHVIMQEGEDDGLDWGQGWTGAAQHVLVIEGPNSDRCVEADNNEDNFDSQPRSKPRIANLTCLSPGRSGSQGAELRRGTGANIHNSIFKDIPTCLRISDAATFANAGAPGALTGQLTLDHSYVFNCQFKDGAGATFSVADWFQSQPGNVVGDPQLDGFMPLPGSPVLTGAGQVPDPWFTPTLYIGAFGQHNWAQGWTFGL